MDLPGRRPKGDDMQTKLRSLIEVVCNLSTGMIMAWLTTQYIAVPLLGVTISPTQNVVLTIILTVVSLIRSYMWRRIFTNINRRARKNGRL